MIKIANHTHYHKSLARHLIERLRDYPIEQDLLLKIEDTELTLCSDLNQQKTCFSHSFTQPNLIRRAAQKNQALLKACNNKKRELKTVLDLTAGWGKDSFVLASHGQQVTLLEQNPLVYHCLDYLLQIARQDQPDNDLFQRLHIIHKNSIEQLMQQQDSSADCLYLDPMFPAHKSGARPAKDLQMLQLVTENIDIEALFELALHKAGHRVVVKRPIHAPTINNLKPDIVYREKTIRFDVYLRLNRGN